MKILLCFNNREFIHVIGEEASVSTGPYFQQLIFHWQVFTLIIFYADMQLWVMLIFWLFSLVSSLILRLIGSTLFCIDWKWWRHFVEGWYQREGWRSCSQGTEVLEMVTLFMLFLCIVFFDQPKNWKFIWPKWIAFQNLDSLLHLSFAKTLFFPVNGIWNDHSSKIFGSCFFSFFNTGIIV